MKSIRYVGDTLLTGDDVAEALLSYAQALAVRETSAAVDIPVRLPDGRIEFARFLLGPASQLVAVPAESEYDEIEDADLVAELGRMADLLRDPRPRIGQLDDPNTTILEDLEYPAGTPTSEQP